MVSYALGDCGGCYACCTRAGSPPFRTDAERDAIPQALRDELEAYYASVAGGQSREAQGLPCLWLDEVTGTCSHYADRPPICSEFVVGDADCVGFITLGVGVPSPPWSEDPR